MALDTNHCIGDSDAIPENAGRVHVLHCRVDCSEDNVANGDVVKLFEMHAGMRVIETIVDINTVEGGTLTVTLGDYLDDTTTEVDLDGYEASMDANADASYSSLDGAAAYATGKMYRDSTAMLGLLFNNAADTAIIDVYAIVADCRP